MIRYFLFVGILVLGLGQAEASSASKKNHGGHKFDGLRKIAQSQLAESNAPAVSIAIYKKGKIIFSEAYGTKSASNTEKVNPDTLFKIGSTTKMFTALAALRMSENYDIPLDAKLMDLLPGIQVDDENARASWEEINLHHLMTHQGGFWDYVGGITDTESLLSYARQGFPNEWGQMNPAGRFYNYSNPNWSYIGAILEHHYGMYYPEIMENEVFRPLGMKRTTQQRSSLLSDGNYALGYGLILRDNMLSEGGAESLDEIMGQVFGVPAGSDTWATPSEVVKMAKFLFKGNHTILPNRARKKMITPQVDMQMELSGDYGYGVFLADGFVANGSWYPQKVWQHGGANAAYSSMFWMLPEEEVAVSILSSGLYDNFSDTMLAALDAVVNLPAPQEVPIEPVARELFHQHVGRYEGEWGIADVWVEDDQLRVNIPAYDEIGIPYTPQLTPLGASVFTITVDGVQERLTFIPEVQGEQSVYIRSRGFVGIRNDEAI